MVTIPTIDQISGTTVMNKLRSLINAFINYANDMNEEITVISTQSSSAYEIATQTAATVQDNFYTKSEVNTLLSRKAYEFDCMDPLFIIQYSAYMNRIGIHLDGETIINSNSGLAVNIDDNTLYYDSVSGKVKALSYSAGVGTSMNLAREISVNVGNGLYVDTNNAVISKIDGETIKFDSNGVMNIPIDNDTIIYDTDTGKLKSASSKEWELVTTNDWVSNIASIDLNAKTITLLKDCFLIFTDSTNSYSFFIGCKGSILKYYPSQYSGNIGTTFIVKQANSELFMTFKTFSIYDIFQTTSTVTCYYHKYMINETTLSSSSVTQNTETIDKKIVEDGTTGIRLYVK